MVTPSIKGLLIRILKMFLFPFLIEPFQKYHLKTNICHLSYRCSAVKWGRIMFVEAESASRDVHMTRRAEQSEALLKFAQHNVNCLWTRSARLKWTAAVLFQVLLMWTTVLFLVLLMWTAVADKMRTPSPFARRRNLFPSISWHGMQFDIWWSKYWLQN